MRIHRMRERGDDAPAGHKNNARSLEGEEKERRGETERSDGAMINEYQLLTEICTSINLRLLVCEALEIFGLFARRVVALTAS